MGGPHFAEGLVMGAVPRDVGLAGGAGQQAPRLDVETVPQQVTRVAVVRIAGGPLDLKVLPQRPAARDVQHLNAAAYSEHRQAVGDRPLRKGELERVQLGHQVEVAVVPGDGVVATRLDIRAAWQEQPVEELVVDPQAVLVVYERDRQGDRARALDRVEVRSVQRELRRKSRAGERAQRNSDDGHVQSRSKPRKRSQSVTDELYAASSISARCA